MRARVGPKEQVAVFAAVERVIAELYELSRDSRTVVSVPRVVQAWGYRPLG